MHRIKRIITVTAITAITAGSVPAIAAASTNTSSGSPCDAMPALINSLAMMTPYLDPDSAAHYVLHGIQQALFDAAIKNCP